MLRVGTFCLLVESLLRAGYRDPARKETAGGLQYKFDEGNILVPEIGSNRGVKHWFIHHARIVLNGIHKSSNLRKILYIFLL